MKYFFRHYCLFGLFCFVCFSACKNNTNSGNEINDSISTHRIYYDNGNFQAEVTYINGRKEGIERNYYRNGKLMEQGLNKNDKKDSTWVSYYGNGNIEEVVNYENGLTLGEAYTYYPDNKIKEFFFNDADGPLYIRDYDSLGNIIRDEGFPAFPIFNKFNLTVNEEFEVIILFGLLPECEARVTITDISNNANKVIKLSSPSDFYKKYHSTNFSFSKNYYVNGDYQWKIEMKIVDKKYDRELNYKFFRKFTFK